MLGVMSMNILLYSLWDDPWGGWAFGSRYLVPTYALLAIFLSSFLVYARRYFIVLLFILCIGVYSVIVNSAGALSTIAIPPKVEVLDLEKLSGREEKYTFMRGIDLLKNGDSKSFLFRAKAHTYVSAWQYYLIITTVISVLMIALIVSFYFIA
jgi:hypothetical protein